MSFFKDIIDFLTRIFQWWVIVMPWEKGIRLRVGKHWTIMHEGIYLKLPIVDRVYIQSTSKRIISGPVQTLTTKDAHTLTVCASIGYCVADVKKLYMSVFHTELTIANLVLSEVAQFISDHDLRECSPKAIEGSISNKVEKADIGIGEISVTIIGYALVKTYRLIQDGHNMYEGFNMNEPPPPR